MIHNKFFLSTIYSHYTVFKQFIALCTQSFNGTSHDQGPHRKNRRSPMPHYRCGRGRLRRVASRQLMQQGLVELHLVVARRRSWPWWTMIMAVSGTAFQASFTHCTTVGYEARRIHPVAVKLLSPLFIQSSQMCRSSALKHLLTEISRGWSSLVRPPGMTAGMESVARILSFVTSLIWARIESRTSRLFFCRKNPPGRLT